MEPARDRATVRLCDRATGRPGEWEGTYAGGTGGRAHGAGGHRQGNPMCQLIRADTFCLQGATCGLAFFTFVFVLVHGWMIGSIFGPPGFVQRCGPLCRELGNHVPRFSIGGPIAEHGCPRTESSREIVTLRKDWRISHYFPNLPRENLAGKIWPRPTPLNGLDPLF